MRTRRTASTPPLLLLSFQDIMTAVTAIVLLCMLSLALDLLSRGHASTPDPAALQMEELQQELAAGSERLAELRRDVEYGRQTLEAYSVRDPEGMERDRDALRNEAALLEREIAKLRPRQSEIEQQSEKTRTATDAVVVDIERKIEAARRTAEEYKRRARDVEAGDPLVYNPTSSAGRRVWLVDVAGARIIAVRLGSPGQRLEFGRNDGVLWRNRFRDWVRSLTKHSDMLMILIRPSGIEYWDTLEQLVQNTGCQFGYDLVGEDRQVLVPTEGRPVP